MGNIAEWLHHILNQTKLALLDPKQLYKETQGEALTPVQVYLAYILPLSAIPAVAVFLGSLLIGVWGVTATFGAALKTAFFMYLGVVLAVSALAVIMATLSPVYGGTRDLGAAMTLVATGYLPAFFMMVLWIWPSFGMLATILAMGCIYFVYCGVEVFLKVPEERRVAFVLVSFILTGLVLLFVMQLVTAISISSSPMPGGIPMNMPIPK